MKKFFIRDEDNKEYEVEEVETEVEEKETTEDELPEASPASLSEADIAALKKLASISDKLVALVEIEKDEHADEPESEMLDEDEDEDEEEIEENEEIIDTDEDIEKMTGHDSKKSVGSIATKTKNKDAIADEHETDVADAWAKRYGGK